MTSFFVLKPRVATTEVTPLSSEELTLSPLFREIEVVGGYISLNSRADHRLKWQPTDRNHLVFAIEGKQRKYEGALSNELLQILAAAGKLC